LAKRRRATDRYRWRDQDDYYGWRPYVDQAERRSIAKRHLRQLEKSGCKISPVLVEGRKIARTFWGSAWCDNLERYSDFANRLPRGRTYVRNGSVIDLQAGAGNVSALVCGSEIYTVNVDVASVPAARWRTICAKCAGGIDSLVELLQGRFSAAVMEHICREGEGLFPAPKEIKFSCSCPDWAYMCKHVAAVLYGIGTRLDEDPSLFFVLRKVKMDDLITQAVRDKSERLLRQAQKKTSRVIDDADLGDVFGIEMEAATAVENGGSEATTVEPVVSRKARCRISAEKVRTKRTVKRAKAIVTKRRHGSSRKMKK